MNAHTPAPWKTRRSPNGDLDVYGGMEFVATFGHAEGTDPDRIEADGRLICAAPELLAAVRDYLELEHATDTYCERCEKHAPKDKDGIVVGFLTHRDNCVRAAAEAAIAKAEGRL